MVIGTDKQAVTTGDRLMQTLTLNDGLTLHYRVDGRTDGPPLLFSNSLGTNLSMWDAQVADLSDTFRIVRYDTRGHGASGLPTEPTTLDRLGQDLLALLDHLEIGAVHVCGISLGGLTAQWLAIHQPTRVQRLILSNTAARIGSPEIWNARIEAVATAGMEAIVEAVLKRFFSPAFHRSHPEVVQQFGTMLRATDGTGYTACCAAVRDADLRSLVGGIRAPTLIIGSSLDESTPPAQAEALHAAITGSELLIIEGVAHLTNIEQPTVFSNLLRHFNAVDG